MYRAYELSPALMTDLAEDEEVRADLVDSLWTVTHPEVVARLTAGAGREHLPSPDDADLYWQELFEDGDDEYTLAYRLLTSQHALGQRVSVLLESEGDAVTHFKLYGLAPELSSELRAMVGFPERRPEDPQDGPFMRRGDVDDPVFVEYLGLLANRGVI